MPIVSSSVCCARAGEPGQLLHPIIMRGLPENANVADIGTGDASFLVALSQELPSIGRLDGFDVAPRRLAPNVARRPIDVHCHDARKPFPQKFHGMYDVVSMHYMTAEYAETAWRSVVHNLKLLLRPRGAIQLIEPDLHRVWNNVSETLRIEDYPLLSVYQSWVSHYFMKQPPGLANLTNVFETLGIRFVQRDYIFFNDNADYLSACNRAMFEAWDEIRMAMDKTKREEILRVVRSAAVNEIQHRYRWRHDKHVVIGIERMDVPGARHS